MIVNKWRTQVHKCFLCGRALTAEQNNIIWDKNNHKLDEESKVICNSDGSIVHGVNVICKCGLCQVFNPMVESEVERFYTSINGKISPYREIYTYTKESVKLHAMNSFQFLVNCVNRISLSNRRLEPEVKSILLVGAADKTTYEVYRQQFPNTTEIYTYDMGMSGGSNNYQTLPNRQFDCIIATNVMEHVYNPVKWLVELSTLCHLETKLVLSVPDLLTNTINVTKDQWFSNAHLYHFTITAVTMLLNKAGFNLTLNANVAEEMGDKIYALCKINTQLGDYIENKFMLNAKEIADIKELMRRQDEAFIVKRRLANAINSKCENNRARDRRFENAKQKRSDESFKKRLH